jgi:hypothetical protein
MAQGYDKKSVRVFDDKNYYLATLMWGKTENQIERHKQTLSKDFYVRVVKTQPFSLSGKLYNAKFYVREKIKLW